MTIRDRIKDFRRVKGRDLLPNPRNWRRHPQAQRDAMRAILEEVGFAGAALARETPAGLMLIDGHLRAELEPDAELPVLVVDVDDAEAAKLLATFDPLGKMAEPDPDALGKLLAEIETESEALGKLLNELAEDKGIDLEGDGEEDDQTYTNKIIAPVYEPKGEKPPLSALIDRAKTQELLAGIAAADLPDDVKEFLRLAAERHTVFNFRQIAEFYCHADATLQDLMERSGLIIIDFHKAIEYGFVHLTERLGQLADLEEADSGDA